MHINEFAEERSIALPNELIEQIFYFIPLTTLRNAALVCKQWLAVSQSPFLWKKICHLQGFGEKNATIDWRDFAKSQLEQMRFFKRDCLRYQPVMYSNFPESNLKLPIFREPKRYLCKKSSDYDVVIWDEQTQEQIYECKNKFPIEMYSLYDNLLFCTDIKDTITIWNIKNGNVVREYRKNENSLAIMRGINLCDNILVIYLKKELPLTREETILHVHYLDKSEEDFAFKIKFAIAGAVLKGNILTVTARGFATLYFVNLKDKQMMSYDVASAAESCEMHWRGLTLYCFSTYFFAEDQINLQTFDFSGMKLSETKPEKLFTKN